MSSIRQVVFQGGGGKGIAYLGALRALQRRLPKFATGGSFDPITGIGGASAGAITAFLVSCGFPLDGEKQSISKYARNSDFSSLLKQIKPSLSRVVKKNGVPFNKGGQSSIPTIGMPSPRPSLGRIIRTAISDEVATAAAGVVQLIALVKLVSAAENTSISDDYGRTSPAAKLLISTVFRSEESTLAAIRCLTSEFGIFSGVELRQILQKWLVAAVELNGQRLGTSRMITLQGRAQLGLLTFAEFHDLTKIDLRVTGTNLTTGRPFVFSSHNSESFPVTEAVGISMSIPFAFKPVLVEDGNGKVDAGHWVDGGVLNNLPLHIFDSDDFGGSTLQAASEFNTSVLGFELVPQPTSASVPTPARKLSEYFGGVANTLMYPASGGQVTSKIEAEHIIGVPSGLLDTLDFSPPADVKSAIEQEAERAVLSKLPLGTTPGSPID